MNSSRKSMHTLILIPLLAGLIGTLMLVGMALLPDQPAKAEAPVAGKINSHSQIARSGDGARSFHVARPESHYESFAM